jgi:hypothetical protein
MNDTKPVLNLELMKVRDLFTILGKSEKVLWQRKKVMKEKKEINK